MKAVEVKTWCQCGGYMRGRVAGGDSHEATDMLLALFWSVHKGDGHGPATKEEAAAVRRRSQKRRKVT